MFVTNQPTISTHHNGCGRILTNSGPQSSHSAKSKFHHFHLEHCRSLTLSRGIGQTQRVWRYLNRSLLVSSTFLNMLVSLNRRTESGRLWVDSKLHFSEVHIKQSQNQARFVNTQNLLAIHLRPKGVWHQRIWRKSGIPQPSPSRSSIFFEFEEVDRFR